MIAEQTEESKPQRYAYHMGCSYDALVEVLLRDLEYGVVSSKDKPMVESRVGPDGVYYVITRLASNGVY